MFWITNQPTALYPSFIQLFPRALIADQSCDLMCFQGWIPLLIMPRLSSKLDLRFPSQEAIAACEATAGGKTATDP